MLGLLLVGSSTMLAAQSTVQLTRAVYVERQSPGNTAKIIEPASEFRRGETVILMVKWQSANGRKPFLVTSLIPRALQYQRSSHDRQLVSVDGGRNWGKIGKLQIVDRYGERLASAEDVTHLRWSISARMAKRGSGQVSYSAIVR